MSLILAHPNRMPLVTGEAAFRPWPDAAWPDLEPDPRAVDLELADEQLAAEELVLAAHVGEAYDEDVVTFFRTLAAVLAIGLATWVVIGAVALQVYGLLAS